MNRVYKDLITLLACAVNGITPDKEAYSGTDFRKLYQAAELHTVRAAVNVALERAGIRDAAFQEAYHMAVRKNILLDIEEQAILAEFEQRGIRYMTLKGAVLKELYPEDGMREMSDHDILYDGKFRALTKEIMLQRGYKAEHYGKGHCDEYLKPPVYNFELHHILFRSTTGEDIYRYYRTIGRKLLRDRENPYRRYFADADFYVYMVAHEYKHFNLGGIGIRSLLDRYVFLKSKGALLDRAYIAEQLNQLGIREYEKQSRALAAKLFSSAEFPELTEDEQELLSYYLSSATHGTVSHAAENRLKKHYAASKHQSRFDFIRSRLFPDLAFMKQYYPFFVKHPVLLPAGYVWRLVKGIFTSRRKLHAELRALRNYDHKKVQNRR